ncbi:hypothetical protein BSKO_14059 [Bryopsis sp. KO-2023]|nr:hypothetical protein BSKO_14059 [Bryopsis sp. KO-2023]
MAARGMLIAFAVIFAVAAEAGEVPSLGSCEISAASMGAKEFVNKVLDGSAGCVDVGDEDKQLCCAQVRRMFGEGGRAEFCLCNVDFFSAMLMVIPDHTGVDPSSYADMLEECDVPVAGKLTCPGVEEETPVEPEVQSQISGALVLGALASRGRRPPSPKRTPKPTPPPTLSPAPTPAPAPPPIPVLPAGKKPKVFATKNIILVAPEPKKAAVAAPVNSEVPVPQAAIDLAPKSTVLETSNEQAAKGVNGCTERSVPSWRAMAVPRRMGGRKLSGGRCLNDGCLFLIAVTLGISWWYIAAHQSCDLLAGLSPARLERLPHVDDCKTCGHCVVESDQLSKPSDCAQPIDGVQGENSMVISAASWRLSSDYQDVRKRLPHCPICRGCLNALENVDQRVQAFNTTFVHKSGGSSAWYFYTDVKCPGKMEVPQESIKKLLEAPSPAEQPRAQAVVKMWCLPFDHQMRPDPYDPQVQDIRHFRGSEIMNKMHVRPTKRSREEYCNKAMPYEIVQKEISMMRIAEECGLSSILPKVWVAPVKAIMPGTGYPIDMDALWQTRAPGVSLHNLAHWSTKPEIVLETLNHRVNSSQVVMAAIFDLLTSQCDRKANNLFLDEEGGITLIDNNQALASGHMCDVGRQLNSIFLPSSVEHTFRAVGRQYAKHNFKRLRSHTPSPHVMMDYRCHSPGGEIGKNYPPKVKQCLTKFQNMDAEGLMDAFGLIDSKSATILKTRAAAMLHGGFEWALLNAPPLNSAQYRYSPQPPCCKMHSSGCRSGFCRFECDGGWKPNPNLHRPIFSQKRTH